MRRAFLIVLAAIAAAIGAARDAAAHAFLDHAVPAVGSTVSESPSEISAWFTQELEPVFSAIEVTDAAGQRVDKADPRVDPSDATELHVSLKPLKAGTYRVHWHVVSVDTHRTEGNFNFTVAPP
jgi:copper resistance protein C